MRPELDQLYEMIDDLEVAMMTTRREDGHLESRAMATQKRATGADLWFVAAEGTGKLADVGRDPHVNLAYYKDRTREWISVSGWATLSRDRETIRELYSPDWKMWFGEEGDHALDFLFPDDLAEALAHHFLEGRPAFDADERDPSLVGEVADE